MALRRFLYNSGEVRQAINQLFTSPSGRRVAVVAFVGDGADTFVGNPKGLELICWPASGGTNPKALARLMQKGAKVRFANNLHAKIYWAEGRGAVITSANLSTNALGAGNLRECGVLLSAHDVKIGRIISSVRPRAVTKVEMRKLHRQHDQLVARNRGRFSSPSQRDTYLEWFQSPWRRDWKFGWWNTSGATSVAARERARTDYGTNAPFDSLNCKKSDYKSGNWILNFCLNKNKVSDFQWLFSDFVVKVPRTDKKAYEVDYPCQVVQVWKRKYYSSPPFQLDRRFKEGFAKTVKQVGGTVVENATKCEVPKSFLTKVAKNCGL